MEKINAAFGKRFLHKYFVYKENYSSNHAVVYDDLIGVKKKKQKTFSMQIYDVIYGMT